MLKRSSFESKVLFGIFAAGFAASCMFSFLQQPPLVFGKQQFKPLVIHSSEQISSGGQSVPEGTRHSTVARRRDGSWSHYYTGRNADGKEKVALEFADFARMISVRTEATTLSVTTLPLTDEDLPIYMSAIFGTCDGSEKQAEQRKVMLGYDVVLIATTDIGGTIEKWIAPALDCYSLQTIHTLGKNRSEETVTSVEAFDPPKFLFETPSGYVERSPKETNDLYGQRIPGAFYYPPNILERAERKYQSARPGNRLDKK